MKVGILYSRVRAEEKLLFQAFDERGVDYDLLDDRKLDFELSESDSAADAFLGYDVVLERCINHSRALASLRVLNEWGIPTVNTADVAEVCGNKLHTSSVLARAKVKTPRTFTAFTPHSALETIMALKILPEHLARDAEATARFQREAKVMAQLRFEDEKKKRKFRYLNRGKFMTYPPSQFRCYPIPKISPPAPR